MPGALSLILLPFFVWLTRRVGAERKRITAQRQGRMADMSALISALAHGERADGLRGDARARLPVRRLLARERLDRDHPGHPGAFTQLQTRVFFPIQSLLSVQIDLQTSGALFTRIFEYLDLPVDIEESGDTIHLTPREVRGDVRFEDVSFGYDPDGPPTVDG